MLTATVKEEFIKMEKSVDQTNIKLAFITMPLIITLYFNDRYKINNNKKIFEKAYPRQNRHLPQPFLAHFILR